MPCELKDSMPIEIYAALLGAFIGVLFTYWFALLINKAQTRSIAAANFRATFSYTISQMAIAQIDSSINIETLLNRTFPDLAVAIETYRPFVPCKSRERYQQDWDDYYQVGGGLRFFYYSNREEKEAYPLFKKRIEAILNHANP